MRNEPAAVKFLDLGPIARAQGTVKMPGSKSISNRVLLLAALSEGETRVENLLDSDDTRVMLEALARLGVRIERQSDDSAVVHGVGGSFPVKSAELRLGNAGTAFRPLAAALALAGGEYRLSGAPRMHERPIGDLVDALRRLGARIEYSGAEGFPPLVVRAGRIRAGDKVRVRGEVERNGWKTFTVPAKRYASPGEIHIEGDASSASYFLAAGAISGLSGGGPVRVEGVGRASIQGDVRFTEVLERMGAAISMGENWIESSAGREARARGKLTPIDADFNHIPDAAMTAAVTSLFAEGPSTLRNIANWRVKETDRLRAVATELRKLGAGVEQGADSLRVTPPARLRPATIDTYDDHRMAMSFSLAALGGIRVRINDPACVRKTFPQYFDLLAGISRRAPA